MGIFVTGWFFSIVRALLIVNGAGIGDASGSYKSVVEVLVGYIYSCRLLLMLLPPPTLPSSLVG